MKNPHAVALGRLGGAKGGRARAKALSPRRRRQIAREAGAARARALSPAQRKDLARQAAIARWSRPTIVTASDAPITVQRLLKSYDPAQLRWADANERYTIVREILVRGDAAAKRWLDRSLSLRQTRALVRAYRGAGCNEPDRKKLRKALDLTVDDIPIRPFIGFRWRAQP